MSFTIEIRRGVVVNTDPQRRCYNGCHASSRTDWGPWELWIKDNVFSTREQAEFSARLFRRENQQLRVVEVV